MVALRSMKAGRFYLRFLAGGAKSDHLHVDLARTNIFPPGRKPKINSKAPEILRCLDGCRGQQVELQLLGRFIVTVAEPQLDAGLLSLGSRSMVPAVNGATAEPLGSLLRIRNDAHINFLQWDVLGTDALVDIYGHCATSIADPYLVDAFNILQKAFTSYVLGETTA